ncbi:serine/threonine-protein kinase [Polyangium sp. 15x6]|uniref:serine/threonine-protein kinase n=1 Tax=Polyangium sp. 15x6 TaxID=3042687 RepID=UPI00249B35BB|nr:serine/threonine-protein kinase [Polyangium sp. 15x6]MDI3290304.1 serine/threonine-protein kinase [Polyangium sp. 15x6]
MASAGGPAAPGDVVAQRYRVESWLGQGNMAAVYRATHLGTGHACALKLVLPQLVDRDEIRNLFVQEARVGARIGKNPHIVDVFDAGIDPQRGVPYLAMELLEGDTLDKYVKQRGPVPPGLMRILFLQLADALGQAHAAGVVHRDLKPGNLFLTYDRRKSPLLKVVDFGIAKVLEEGIQGTATQVGSPAYAAPEQLGASMRPMAAKMGVVISHGITPQTDVWALGVIAYELLLGAPPGHLWTGAERGTVADMVMGVAIHPTPSAVARAGFKAHVFPRGFDEWLERCLRKNAAERWPNVEEAVRALAELLDSGYDDGETQQIRPQALLGIRKPQSMEATMPLPPKPRSVPPPPVQTAVLPPGFYPALEPTAPPPPEPQKARPAGLQTLPLHTPPPELRAAPPPPLEAPLPPSARAPLPSAPAHVGPAYAPTSSMQAPIVSASQPFLPSIPQLAATTHGLAATTPPTTGSTSKKLGIVLGVSALLAALGLVAFVLIPKTGGLRIEVTGRELGKVAIYVDGQERCGTTPCVVGDLAPGDRIVKVVAPGKGEKIVSASVERGEESPVLIPLEGVEPQRANPPDTEPPRLVEAPSTPPAESPSVPEVVGTIPAQTPGDAARAPGPSPTTPAVGTTTTQAAQNNGTLNINSIPVSKVVLDGRPLGSTPKVGLSVPAGTHTVTFIHPEKGKQTVTVTVKAGESKTAAVKFK